MNKRSTLHDSILAQTQTSNGFQRRNWMSNKTQA